MYLNIKKCKNQISEREEITFVQKLEQKISNLLVSTYMLSFTIHNLNNVVLTYEISHTDVSLV
jgi:hypothetical protein